MAIPPGLNTDRKVFISGRLEATVGWIVKGQHIVNAACFPFAPGRTEGVVDASTFQERFQVGDVGTLRIDPSKQGAAGGELLLALVADDEAVINTGCAEIAAAGYGRGNGDGTPRRTSRAMVHSIAPQRHKSRPDTASEVEQPNRGDA
jgi:hypothetical protein